MLAGFEKLMVSSEIFRKLFPSLIVWLSSSAIAILANEGFRLEPVRSLDAANLGSVPHFP